MRESFASIVWDLAVMMMDEELIKHFVGGERFTKFGEYRFDKLIFGIFTLTMLFIFVIMFLVYGSDRTEHIYYTCNTAGDQPFCENPFLNNHPTCERIWDGACDQELIMNGFSYGEKAPWIVDAWGFIVGGLLFCAFLINHLIHNRGKRLEME